LVYVIYVANLEQCTHVVYVVDLFAVVALTGLMGFVIDVKLEKVNIKILKKMLFSFLFINHNKIKKKAINRRLRI